MLAHKSDQRLGLNSSDRTLEKGSAGAWYHGVAEEGIAFRDIAEVIGRRLNIPVVAKSPEETAIILAGLQSSLDSIARPQAS